MHDMGMMHGLGAWTTLWMPVAMLLWLVLLAAVIWLVVGFLNHQKTPMIPYAPQPRDASPMYEQGYQPQQHLETYQEGGQWYHYPQPKQEYDQPQVQYPEAQAMPEQR